MEKYSWDMLSTIAGSTGATLLIVQYLKVPLDKLLKVKTRILVVVVSFSILLLGEVFGSGPFQWEGVPLTLVNSFVVALSSMGAYENTFKLLEDKSADKSQDEPME